MAGYDQFMSREFPASVKSAPVAVHFSAKPGRRGWGVMVGVTNTGKFTVNTVGPVNGRPTYNAFAVVDTEAEARKVANREWVGMGL